MATVVNDRDIQIMATIPRVAGVTLGANITIGVGQVDGLGIVLDGTKGISLLSTSQVIQVQTDGTMVPAGITLTANLANITGTPTLTIVAGSGTMSVTPALTAGVFTFTPAQLTSDVITFRLSVTDAGQTYSDDMTIMKVYQGSDGLSGLLTNESVTLPADYLGNVLSYANATGNFKVYHGTQDVTTVCTFSIPTGGNPDSLTNGSGPLVVTSGTNAGTFTVAGGVPSGHDYSSLTIRATFGTTTIDKVFTIAKAKAGTPGTNGTIGSNGTRGSVTLYVALAGSTATWSDSTAASAVTSYTGTAPIRLDTVTEYNNSQSFSLTKFYDGTAWQTVNAVVNGNLLVTGTVGGDKMIANTVDFTKIDSRNLTIKDAAGTVIFGSGTNLVSSYITPAAGWLNSNVTASSIGAVGSGNPITSGNVSTYIAAAAINLAYINTASIGNLSALSANIGTLQTASSGQRLVIKDNKIGVFDSSNVLRVRIGDLSGTF